MITAPGAFIKAMETVVKEHLMQYGYPLDGTEIE